MSFNFHTLHCECLILAFALGNLNFSNDKTGSDVHHGQVMANAVTLNIKLTFEIGTMYLIENLCALKLSLSYFELYFLCGLSN